MTKHTDKIEDFDFGFSFAEDTSQIRVEVDRLEAEQQNHQQTIDELNKRIQELYTAILPLLDNLSRDPDKPSILWPDRATKIEAYKKKLQAIVEGK
jgi:hypothetical protein